jgi:hypothetical protein
MPADKDVSGVPDSLGDQIVWKGGVVLPASGIQKNLVLRFDWFRLWILAPSLMKS